MTPVIATKIPNHPLTRASYKGKRKSVTKSMLILLIVLIIVSAVLPYSQPGFSSDSNALKLTTQNNPSTPLYNLPVSENSSTNSLSLYPNPYEIYWKEPAPMGIADYGIGPNGNPYSYDSSSFMGVADVQNLTTTESGSQYSDALSFQLNLNLVFTNGGSLYVYWIQDVMTFNTSSRYVSFIDNIWNFSSRDANVYSSAVIGNGTIGYGGSMYFYYDTASPTLPGNDIPLLNNYKSIMMVNVSVSNSGYPVVNFLYNDGYGWVTYDKATFVVANNLSSTPAFLVDGIQYEPTGYTFYDAEFVIGGTGGGGSAIVGRSEAQLQLEYFNGHNYQIVSNAYNFGSNTAEKVGNVTVVGNYYGQNGSLFSNVTAGPGNLGILYQQTQVSVVNISTPISSGTLYVNGTAYPFTGGSVNVTLGPSVYPGISGYYVFQIYSNTGTLLWSKDLDIAQGEYLSLNIATYPVTFNENSFPPSTLWYLNLSDGQSFKSTNSSITFNLPNGNYSYTATPVGGGYYPVTGSIEVNGSALEINVQFNPVQLRNYTITFSETGLPGGTTWSVTVNGTTIVSVGNAVKFEFPNGTYFYSIGNVSGFVSSPSAGTVEVTGHNVTVSITFREKYLITFSQTGLPSSTVWYLNLSTGASYSSSTPYISLRLTNGSYSYIYSTSDSRFKPYSSGGTFIVDGSPLQESVVFSSVTYSVEFEKSGLPQGIQWTVTLNGTSESSTGALTFNETNGTYPFSVSRLQGFSANEYSGTITVAGSSEAEPVVWTVLVYAVTFNVSGIPSGMSWFLVVNGTSFYDQAFNKTMSINGSLAVIDLPNGSYSYSIKLPSGYHATDSNGHISISGSSLTYFVSAIQSKNLSYILIVIIAVVAVALAAFGAVFLAVRRKKKLLVREERFTKMEEKEETESVKEGTEEKEQS